MENKLLEEFIFNTFDTDTIMQANTLSDYESDINLFQAIDESQQEETKKVEE